MTDKLVRLARKSNAGGAASAAYSFFIHTADIHLDSPFRSLALRNPELADLVGAGDTGRRINSIIDLCLDERVDSLLIAGDLL